MQFIILKGSQACQSKHWEEHKLKCRQVKSSNNLNSDSSGDSVYRRKKSPGFGSISLVSARGSCRVLQEPKKILFPYDEFIKLFKWDKPGFPPCGLLNCGNSCFANVVLQCLTCTRPLTAYLLEKDHGRTCIRKQEDWCFLCELQTHIQRASKSQQPFSPANILSRIPNIGGNLGYGSQEDAHEFMRFAIDTMQSVCLDEHGGEKALEPSTQETTLIQYIFGGHLQSQVTFRDPESARRSVADPNPFIDGRRANCNIASVGRPRPDPPRGRIQPGSMQQGPPQVAGAPYTRLPAQMHPPHQLFYPTPYGYMAYPGEYGYQQGMYNPQMASQYYQQFYGPSSSSTVGPHSYPYPYFGYPMQSPRTGYQSPFQAHRPPYFQYPTSHIEGSFAPWLPQNFQLQAPPHARQTPNAADSQTPQQSSMTGANTESPDG